jgi:branched-chain amino acid transport system ATP-binding protein
MRLLEVRELTKTFGGLAAVSNLGFAMDEGECLGLIGPNGAGKTTCFNLISGFLQPTKGRIFFKGENITGLKPYVVVKRGLVRTFQLTTLFHNASVLDNVMVAFHRHAKIGFFDALFNTSKGQNREDQLHERAMEILDFMGLAPMKDELAINLPHGHQRSLGVAVALAVGPELMMLDEPVTGMNNEESLHMMSLIDRIRESGVTILLVEHDMKVVMGLCDRIVVINFGRKIAEGTPEEIRANPQVIEAYLGVPEDVA